MNIDVILLILMFLFSFLHCLEEESIQLVSDCVYFNFFYCDTVNEAPFRGVKTTDARYGMNFFLLLFFSFSFVWGGRSSWRGIMII